MDVNVTKRFHSGRVKKNIYIFPLPGLEPGSLG